MRPKSKKAQLTESGPNSVQSTSFIFIKQQKNFPRQNRIYNQKPSILTRASNSFLSIDLRKMDSPNDQVLGDFMTDNEITVMDMEQSNIVEEEEEDPFLKFIDYAKSILYENAGVLEEDSMSSPCWSWIANRILKTCVAYSSGVTPAILLSELSLVFAFYILLKLLLTLIKIICCLGVFLWLSFGLGM